MPIQKRGPIQLGRSAAGTLGGIVVGVSAAPPGGMVAPGNRKIVVVVVGASDVDVVGRRVTLVRGRVLDGAVVGSVVPVGSVVSRGTVVRGVVGGSVEGGGWVEGTLTWPGGP